MMNGSKSGLKACNVIRLSHTNTKDLIIKAGYCTNHCNVTALSAQNIFSQAMLMLMVLLQQIEPNQEPNQVFKYTKTACFYKQKSLRNKAVLWHIAERNERNVAHT